MIKPTSTTALAVAIIYDIAGKRTLIVNRLTLFPDFSSRATCDDDESNQDGQGSLIDYNPKTTKFLMFEPTECHHRRPSNYKPSFTIEPYTPVDMRQTNYKVLALIHIGTVHMESRMVETKLVASRGTQPVWNVEDESVAEQRERLDKWAVDVVFEHFDVDVAYVGKDQGEEEEDAKEAAHVRVENIRKRMRLRALEAGGDVKSLAMAVYTLDDA